MVGLNADSMNSSVHGAFTIDAAKLIISPTPIIRASDKKLRFFDNFCIAINHEVIKL